MKTETEETSPELQREIDRVRALISNPESRKSPRDGGGPLVKGIRPRNAATIILLDGTGGDMRILMGRRNRNLAFMPGALVFPGGRVDPADGSIPSADELQPPVRRTLMAHMKINATARGARALGMAAIRELAEEAGLLIGRQGASFPSMHGDWAVFRDRGVAPCLSGLRLLSRAITPPGRTRRFDTWFFLARAEDVGHVPEGGFEACGELEELRWIRPRDAMEAETREITRVMLVELMHRLERDPGIDPEYPAAFYETIRNSFRKTMMT